MIVATCVDTTDREPAVVTEDPSVVELSGFGAVMVGWAFGTIELEGRGSISDGDTAVSVAAGSVLIAELGNTLDEDSTVSVGVASVLVTELDSVW